MLLMEVVLPADGQLSLDSLQFTTKTHGCRNQGYRRTAELDALRPGAKDVHLHTGELALKLGQTAVAVETFSRAVAASPNDVTAIDSLIRALQKAGRGKTAAIYQKYRETLPVRKR